MSSGDPLLRVEDLRVHFAGDDGVATAIDGVSFDIHEGARFGLVGESGSGKTMTALSVLGLIDPPGVRVARAIRFEGRDLLHASEEELRAVRGRRIGLIMQDPLAALSPVFPVGEQIAETMRYHRLAGRRTASRRAVELLADVGIPDPAARARAYPHELSGGMRQRVAIAIALACEPSLLIADEPTTALDVTIQAEVLELIWRLSEERRMAILLITHDLALLGGFADAVAVMYAGRIVEQGPVDDLFRAPAHPYTRGLLDSQPRLSLGARVPLQAIRGAPPSPYALATGCAFRPRCDLSRDRSRCALETPALRPAPTAGRLTACHFAEELLAAARFEPSEERR